MPRRAVHESRHGFIWFLLTGAILAAVAWQAPAQVTTLYSTGFEVSDGFTTDDPSLVGQGGWIGTETNASGIVTNFLDDAGSPGEFGDQQAFIGFSGITDPDGTLSVWRPLDFDPLAADLPVVTFSVVMAIYDSVSTTNRDYFRWSVYNRQDGGTRLFSLEFDNATGNICYLLEDGAAFIPTDFAFERDGVYDLVITMNFADNLWSAVLGGLRVVDSQPISTEGSALDLGDIDAVWVNRDIGVFGDNFMVFDNYRVTARAYPVWLDGLGQVQDGAFRLQLTGEPERQYAIDVTTDFVDWYALTTNSPGVSGTYEFDDATAPDHSASFYRARLVE